jgi:hypothetical protein
MTTEQSESVEAQTESVDAILDNTPKLYAGKFKSVEELEKGYKQSLPLHQRNKELEAELQKLKSVPDDYSVPSDVDLRDAQLNELKIIAKRAGLNEEQFASAAQALNESASQQISAFAERKESLGEEKLNLLKGFVEKNFNGFDDNFRETMFNHIIRDDKIMSDAMKQREQQLNSQVPGMSGTAGVPSRSDQLSDANRECEDLGRIANERPNDMRAREQFIKKCQEVGHYKEELRRNR